MNAPTWTPSEAGGIPRDTPLNETAGDTGLPWERAPDTSHLHSFRFYDARKFGFLRKFGAEETRGASQLQVRFKHPKTGAPQTEYHYYFHDHDEGVAYYAKMASAASPGEVVDEMRKAGVPYQKQGQFS